MARGARYSRTLLGRRSSSFTLILAALLTASVVLPMLLGFGVFSLPVGSDDRAKPDLRPLRSVHEAKDDMGQIGDQWTEVLSWEPRAFIYHKFLSKKECDYLIELAKPHMEKSTVVDSATGWSKDSRFSIMKLVRNTIRTMILSMMNSIPRMGVNVLLPFSCILYLLLSSHVEEGGETVFPF